MEENNKNINEILDDYPRWKKLIKLVSRVVLIIFLIFFLLAVAIQLPVVQNFIVGKVSNYLSDRLETEVSVGGFSLNFFDDISLEEVLIRDLKNDTLIYAGSIDANFDRPLTTLIDRRLFLGSLSINRANFYLQRGSRDSLFNLNQILNNLNKKEVKEITEKKENENVETNFHLDLRSIYLKDIHFLQNDSLYGSKIDVVLHDGAIDIQNLNFKGNEYVVDGIELENGTVEVLNYQGSFTGPYDDERSPEILINVDANKLKIQDIDLRISNLRRPQNQDRGINFNNLKVNDIAMDANGLSFYNWWTRGHLNDFSFETEHDFTLKHMSADSIIAGPTMLEILNGKLKSSRSDLDMNLQFDYDEFGDFKNFVNNVEMHVDANNSEIGVEDIVLFAPKLYENSLFANNLQNSLIIDGKVDGTVNNLRSDQVFIKLGNSVLNGKILIQNVASQATPYLNLDVAKLSTDMEDIKSFIVNDSLSDKLMNLGRLTFKGKYKGSFQKFTANGSLNTDIGSSQFNVNMDIQDGAEDATYSGNLSMRAFDLGKLLENKNLGIITLDTEVRDGKGLTLNSVNSKIIGAIDSFVFMGYAYEDISIDGSLEDYKFSGELETADENIYITIIGDVDLKNMEHPSFDVKANLYNADLEALNLTDYPMIMRFDFVGDVDSFDIYDFDGSAQITNVNIVKMDSIEMNLDSLHIRSAKIDGYNTLKIDSEILQGRIQGDYSLFKSFDAIQSLVYRSYTNFAEQFNIGYDSTYYNTEIAVDLEIINSKNFQKLISPQLENIEDLTLESYLNVKNDSIYLKAFVPYIGYGENKLHNSYVYLESIEEYGNMIVSVDSSLIGGRLRLKPLSIFGDVSKDTLFYTINLAEFSSDNDLNIGGKIYTEDDRLQTSLTNQDLVLFNQEWEILGNNQISFGNKYLNFSNFIMNSGDKIVQLHSEKPNHLLLNLKNIDLAEINEVLDLDSLDFKGYVNVDAEIDNIYDISAMEAEVNIDSFQINRDKYGTLNLIARDNGNIETTELVLNLNNENTGLKLLAEGNISPSNQDEFYDLEVNTVKFPLAALEYLLYKSISGTRGDIRGQFTVEGAMSAPEVNGTAFITNGRTMLDILGVTYFIKDAEVELTPEKIDFTGQRIYDRYDNYADINGALTHDRFKDFGMDINVSSDRFLMMDTDADAGATYYGKAIGRADIDFSGSFLYPNIDIDATNLDSTEFYLNVSSSSDVNEIGFVDFTELDETIDTTSDDSDTYVGPTGLNLSLNIKATEQGEVNIIMNESGEGNIKGRGNGDLQLNLNRNGEIEMFGDYNITSGQYTYSYLIVNKPFDVVPGSYVRWAGDPLDATINIKAKYSTLASPKNLISKYLSAEEAETVSTTQVDLYLLLTGQLFEPEISFDIKLPEVSGQQKVLVDNAMGVLKADQSEMDFQAISLLTFGTFNPSITDGSNFVGNLLGNSITEVLASYASSYLSSFTNEAIRDVDFIDEFNVDVSYDVEFASDNQAFDLGTNPNNNNEFQFKIQNSFFDRKVLTEFGLNYIENDIYNSGTFVGGNGSIEYILSEDRNFRLRGYAAQDLVFEGPRLRAGVGLRYKTQFNSFKDYFQGVFRRQPEE